MKKVFLFYFCVVLGLLSFSQHANGERTALPENPASDPKSFVNPVTEIAFSTYFIYNESTSQYLTQGSDYGTRAAITATNPKSFNVEKTDSYYFLKINNNQANSVSNIYGMTTDDANNVWSDGQSAAQTNGYNRWTFEAGSAAGKFKVSSYYWTTMAETPVTDKFLAPENTTGSVKVLYKTVEDNSDEWAFYPADIITLYGWLKEIDASLTATEDAELETAYEAGITAFNSKDPVAIRTAIQTLRTATGRYILNPGFDNGTIDEWSFSGSNNRNDVGRGSGAAEIYQKVRKLYQIIPALPAGKYKLSAQAFSSVDGGNVFLFAGENETKLPFKTGSENNMAQGAASFEAGTYPVALEFIHPADGDIAIGINSKVNNVWLMFDSFELERITESSLDASVTRLAFDQLHTEITFNLLGAEIDGNVQISSDLAGLAFSVDGQTVTTIAISGAASSTPVTVTYTGTDFEDIDDGLITLAYDNLKVEIPVKVVSETFVPDENNLIPGGGYMNAIDGFSGWGTKSIVSVWDESVYSGIACVKVSGTALGYPNGGTLDVNVAWKPSTLYRLRAMVKTADGDFNIGASNAYVDNIKDKNFKIEHTNGEWVQLDTTFLTGTAAVAGLLYFNNDPVNATGIIAYIDNYELFEVPAVDPTPYIAALQTAKDNASAYYTAIDPANVAGAEDGEVPGKYTNADYTALASAIAAAEAILEKPDASIEEIIAATVALTTAQNACVIYYAKNSLPVDDYYIKKTGSDLYWTNMKAVTNEEKPEFKDLYGENIDEQLWTITLDGGRYKIVNVHPDEYPAESGSYYNRFITEKGTFPQSGKIASGYSQAWNTFDFFYNGTAYAVQRTGSASHEFWQLDASNFVVWTSVDLNASTDFILEFVSVTSVLSEAITAGQAKLDAAADNIGSGNGQYSQSVYDAFAAALLAATEAVSTGATAQDLITFKAAEALFVPNIGTGINSITGGNKTTVFAAGKTIEIHSEVPVKASVYTVTGLLIKETTVNGKQSIPLTNGIYIVKTDTNAVKVIVQ